MRLHPYLTFGGNCEEAFTFYAKCLGGTIDAVSRWEEAPAGFHPQPDWNKKILHMSMKVEDDLLMGSDSPPGYYETPKGISVTLQIKTHAEAKRIFDALAVGAPTIRMPFDKTFFSPGFGMLVDRFGTPWMINSESAE